MPVTGPNFWEFPVSESEEAARQAMTTEHRTATFRVDENQRFLPFKNDWPSVSHNREIRLQEAILISTLGWWLWLPKAPETRKVCQILNREVPGPPKQQQFAPHASDSQHSCAWFPEQKGILALSLCANKSIPASKARPVTIKATVILLLEASNQSVNFTSSYVQAQSTKSLACKACSRTCSSSS